jgi:catechol 2,3-dioxygenase-like lactoylglutathione lyase family enzyme
MPGNAQPAARRSRVTTTTVPTIQRLDHWTLVTSDVERTRRFYADVLGAKLPERAGGPASVNLAGTVIDFFPASTDNAPSPGGWGQHHAYVINLEDYDGWVEHLGRHGIAYTRTTHGLHRMSIYVDDPDGYHIELTVVFDSVEVGRREIEKRGLLEEAAR